ncbi:sensor histidine kinase [Microbacterium paraoxydans]|uniref:Two-component system, NarL family, sensor histidine kinase DesK n=1 Tax=Microbacterium paraoxydans TaxID=199592 RepID=A0A1H1VUX1_9MICO|nr:histidine kinase [Microbacterium paraoxydans]SDS88026.1 two-component system, NarL family, sensor histidine kinase DesK [Microbacterium paraoxydans]
MTMQEGREADVRSGTGKDPWARFGWLMAVVWLVFLIYPVLALLASAAPPAWVVTGWVALVAFIVLYVTGFLHGMRGGGGLGRAPSRRQWITFAALIACALVTIPAVGGSALSFLPFIMSFASYGLTRAWHWISTIAALVVAAGCVFLIPDNLSYLSVLAIVTLLGVVNTVSTWLIVRSAEAERLGRELATSEGREAVARDVHDLIGHSLTVVGLKAQLVRRLMDSDPERAKAELADIERLTAEAIAGVRQTVAGARATTLVEQLASTEDSLRAADIALVVDGTPDALSPVQAITASWILREATTNTLRHSGAAAVRVRIAPGVLSVEDDGVGPASATGHREGNGIRGMRERAAAAGAGFTMRPGEVAGTRVEVTW